MGYFAEKGDLKMMRWLYVNGADTRDKEVGYHFPMYETVLGGHLQTCKWLHAHGASDDIKTMPETSPAYKQHHGLTCLNVAFKNGQREMIRWLLLNGALCKDNTPGELDLRAMRRDLIDDASFWHLHFVEERKSLLEWVTDLHQARTSFLTFLMGTLSPAEYSPSSLRKVLLKKLESEQATSRLLESLPLDQHRQLWDELLAIRARQQPNYLSLLTGKSGILELVCDYVGIVWGREARIIRQLAEVLPGFNKIMD